MLQPRMFGGYEFEPQPSTARSSRSPEVVRPVAGCCASAPATHCSSDRRSRNRPKTRSSGPTGTSSHRSASATPRVATLPTRRRWLPRQESGGMRRACPTPPTSWASPSSRALIHPTCPSSCPAASYEILEDWGELIGLKGSGSNSVVIDDVFVPSHHTVPIARLMGEWPVTTEQLPGGAIHGNPMYSGGFMGFAIGELTSVQVGAARDARRVRALARLLPITSMSGNATMKRYPDHDFQRAFGMSLDGSTPRTAS